MKYYLILFLSLVSISISAQIKDKGLPFIKNYSTSETPLENWGIKQDTRGVMYFANNKGLVEFDGTLWQNNPVANKSIVRSLDIDANGRIYVGAEGEFGYFEPDTRGKLIYHSLFDKIPVRNNKFNDVWKTLVTNQGIIFQTAKVIFIYKDNTIKVLSSKSSFSVCALIKDRIYVNEEDFGLSELYNNELNPIKNGNFFPKEYFKIILPYDDNKLLLGSPQSGFFIYSNDSFLPWNVQIKNLITNNKIVSGIVLKNNYYLISTHQNGFFVIDKQGKVIQHLNKLKGLQSNTIHDMYFDRSGALWLALNHGIDYIEISSPFTFFDDKNNVPGAPHGIALYKDNLYLATSQGVFYNEWGKYLNPLDSSGTFRLVNNTIDEVWNLTATKEGLLCGHHEGAFEIKDGTAEKISDIQGGWTFLNLKAHPDYLLYGTYSGLSILNKKNGRWKFKHKLDFKESSRVMEEDGDGSIWISNTNTGVFKIRLDDKADKIISVKFYNSKNGFPSNHGINVYKLNKEVIFCTEKGIYMYNKVEDKFILHDKWNQIFNPEKHIRKLVEDSSGNIWFSIEEEVGIMKLNPGGLYTEEVKPFKKFNRMLLDAFELFYPIDERNIIIGTKDYFAHYDPSMVKNYNEDFNVLIRRVELISGKDSLVFGGNFKGQQSLISTLETSGNYTYFSRQENNIRFTYSAPYFEGVDKTKYQYLLESFDNQWSEWSSKTLKEYTNLPAGKYKFKVRAKNVYDKETKVAVYAFEIKPSWYETWWFYFIQIVFFVILLSISYFSSRSGKQTKLSYILGILTIITIFEFCILFLEPYVDNLTGGIPLFKLGMNVLLALSLNPIEHLFKVFFIGNEISKK